jgi:hypothetical protein
VKVSAEGIRYLLELKQQADHFENRGVRMESDCDQLDRPNSSLLRERSGAYGIQTGMVSGRGLTETVTQVDAKGALPGEKLLPELRKLVNQYLSSLLGHEPRAMRFLGRLSKLEANDGSSPFQQNI